MAPRRLPSASAAQLRAFLLSPAGGAAAPAPAPDPLADDLASWLASAPRFRAFTDAHRDKVRKKLRLARDADARLDLRAELLVARLLLADRAFELAFEPGGARGGPDFAVTYRGAPAFNLEVTRPRADARTDAGRTILAKLHQLPTGSANALMIALPHDAAAPDIAGAIRAIRSRADAKDEAWFTARDFTGTRDFYDRLLRLGAVIAWREGPGAEAWTNASARIAISERALRACLSALATMDA